MNGNHVNGNSDAASITPTDLAHILSALESIYNPRTTNEQRQSATSYLEIVKSESTAPYLGFQLAQDTSQSPIVRHYGLSVLEHAIRYRLDDFDGNEAVTIRGWIIQLAQNVSENEPAFLRSKVARIWVDLAERTWAVEWMDMDETLCALWQGTHTHQELVLSILELLADEVFNNESLGAAGLRANELGRGCVEIFTSASILANVFSERENDAAPLRSGEQGWFLRLLEMLDRCLKADLQNQAHIRTLASRILTVVQSAVPWIILKAVSKSSCLNLVSQCLSTRDLSIQNGAVEVLHSLFHRTPWPEDVILKVVCPVLKEDGLNLLKSFYESACCKSDEIDDEKYAMLKKFTEMICALVTFIEIRPKLILQHCDLGRVLDFLIDILQNASLVVSIPIVYVWTRLLSVSSVVKVEERMAVIGDLLDICSTRLLRYESLSDDSEDPTLTFLNEDFDTMPERHAFLGNYRRFCMAVIEKIVEKAPFIATNHLLQQATSTISNLYSGTPSFSTNAFSANSAAILRIDAQLTVVLTALKSYQKWVTAQRARGKELAQPNSSSLKLDTEIVQWSKSLLQLDFQDPIISKRIFQLIVEIALLGIGDSADLACTICNYVFTLPEPNTAKSNAAYDEAVKDLQGCYPRELQKLAPYYCNELWAGFPGIEIGVRNKMNNFSIEERIRHDYQSFMFTLIQRTNQLSPEQRYQRLNDILYPVIREWQNPDIGLALQDFQSFSRLLQIEECPQIFLRYRASGIEDWSLQSLNPQELSIRSRINDSGNLLPLQATRALLSVSTERLRPGSSTYRAAQELWREAIPVVVPNLLRALNFSHSFANPATWSEYPDEMQAIISRILVDRVWQSGISNETKDDFYARVRNSKGTLEGLASAIRSAIRNVREVSYWILHCMSILGDVFYCHTDLAEALAHGLFNDARFLSPNQLMSLLKLSTALIEGCPAKYRIGFLPPILTALFREMDFKVTHEWHAIAQRGEQEQASDQVLDQEMKAESILRHLTYACVTLVTNLTTKRVEPSTTPVKTENGDASNGNGHHVETRLEHRDLTIRHPGILEGLITFCNHALRMHDSRCCGSITRVLKGLVPDFAK